MLPRVQPIAPVSTKEPFDDPEWLFDFKYDGFRAVCYLEQGRSRLISRNGNLMSRFAGLGEKIAASLDVDDAILDGQVIAADETGRPQFYDLLRHTRAPAYVAFDVMWLNGADLRPLPLTERRRCLQDILPKGPAIIAEVRRQQARVAAARLKLGRYWSDNDLVFPDESSGRARAPAAITKAFTRSSKRLTKLACGWPEHASPVHSLRHAAATAALAAGVDIGTVSTRLGHSSPAVTLRIYISGTADKDRSAGDAMATAIPRKPQSA